MHTNILVIGLVVEYRHCYSEQLLNSLLRIGIVAPSRPGLMSHVLISKLIQMSCVYIYIIIVCIQFSHALVVLLHGSSGKISSQLQLVGTTGHTLFGCFRTNWSRLRLVQPFTQKAKVWHTRSIEPLMNLCWSIIGQDKMINAVCRMRGRRRCWNTWSETCFLHCLMCCLSSPQQAASATWKCFIKECVQSSSLISSQVSVWVKLNSTQMPKCPKVMPTAPTREQRSDMLVDYAPNTHVQQQCQLNFMSISPCLQWLTEF